MDNRYEQAVSGLQIRRGVSSEVPPAMDRNGDLVEAVAALAKADGKEQKP